MDKRHLRVHGGKLRRSRSANVETSTEMAGVPKEARIRLISLVQCGVPHDDADHEFDEQSVHVEFDGALEGHFAHVGDVSSWCDISFNLSGCDPSLAWFHITDQKIS